MATDETTDLNGKRIVVVEDDYLLATDMCRILRDHGATVLGPAPTPFYAMHLIGRKKIDAAVLDVLLHGTTVYEIADKLREQGVPIIFATGGDRSTLPGRFSETPLLTKPFDRKKLVSEVHAITRRPVVRPSIVPRPVQAGTSVEAPVQIFARALARSLRVV